MKEDGGRETELTNEEKEGENDDLWEEDDDEDEDEDGEEGESDFLLMVQLYRVLFRALYRTGEDLV